MGLFKRSKIGLDIGATAVRVVEISGVDSSGYAIVRRAGVVSMPEGAVVNGEVRRPAVVAQAITEAFRSAGVSRQGVVAGFGARQCAMGQFDVPEAAKPEERTLLLRNSGKDVAPTVATAESALSWNTTDVVTTGRRPERTLNVAAALLQALRPIRDVCNLAEVELRAIDLSAAALLRSVVRIQPEDDTAISTVVDIGASSTIIATREGAHLRSVRTLALGGADTTNALASGLGIDIEVAEEQKRHMRVAERARTIDTSDIYVDDDDASLAPRTSAEDILARSTDELVDEIARSVTADARAHDNRGTQGIQLVGGGSRLGGLDERIAATVGVPCARATAWADVEFSRRTARLLATHEVDQLIDELTVAVGLAMWRPPQ